MGYRSCIGVVCEEQAFKELKDVGKEHDMFFDKVSTIGDGLYVIRMEDVKWYECDEEYADVKAFMGKLKELDNRVSTGEENIGYAYVRVGEDSTDIDERSNSDYLPEYIYPHVEINVDGDEEDYIEEETEE